MNTSTFVQEAIDHYDHLSLDALDAQVHSLIAQHERLYDRECIVLYAGTNTMNPRARALLASSLGSRPSLGHPGEKYNKGVQHAEQIELMCVALLRRLFKANYVEHRVPSGSLANLYACMATCQPGDTILAFSDAAGGHPTHHANGAAGLYGLKVHDMPFDESAMDVDVTALERAAHELRPKLMIVAGSLCLHPYSVRAVSAVADEIGAFVMYDAAHMGGLIAGGRFQDPLREGAHVMTGSTYKSFGGPPSGFVATNDEALAARLDAIAYPGLTANFDMSKTAALAIGAMDLLEHGAAYAAMCIANAQTLAQAMDDVGLDVFCVPGKGFTSSQHIALRANRYGGGDAACKRLERANLIATGIGLPGESAPGDFNAIRLGTQEITRWGFEPRDMPAIAALLARVLVHDEPPEQARPDVLALRANFQALHFVRAA